MRTLVTKFRLCQSVPGFKLTRFAPEAAGGAPFPGAWMTFRWLFFEKGIGTLAQPYKVTEVKQLAAR